MILEIFSLIKNFILKLKKIFKKFKLLKKLYSNLKKSIEFYYKIFFYIIFRPDDYKKFLTDKKIFTSKGGTIDEVRHALKDFKDNAGVAKGHYFNQDLLVANMIFKNNPIKHVDIGSRIDGFVAHVASFREIEVLDIRKLNQTVHSNIKFKQKDIMQNVSEHSICDSISCLHAIEHFGLGRYNDEVDPDGHLKGFQNILKLLKKDGILYISFPIGLKKISFNQRRVFNYKEVLSWSNLTQLERFDFVDDKGDLHLNKKIDDSKLIVYGCGIYTFRKIK